jgi:hypothetical protein
MFERHGAATGTVVPPPSCEHTGVGLPVNPSIFFPMNTDKSTTMTMAAFLAAAISAVTECAPAGTVSGFSHEPAPSAFIFWSPM